MLFCLQVGYTERTTVLRGRYGVALNPHIKKLLSKKQGFELLLNLEILALTYGA